MPEVASRMQRSQSAPLGLSSVDQARPRAPARRARPLRRRFGAQRACCGCGTRGRNAACRVGCMRSLQAPANLRALSHARAALACRIREDAQRLPPRCVARPVRGPQAPWDDLELGRLLRNDACGRTYHATFQGTCVTAKARAAPPVLTQLRPLDPPPCARRTPPPPGSGRMQLQPSASACGHVASPWTCWRFFFNSWMRQAAAGACRCATRTGCARWRACRWRPY